MVSYYMCDPELGSSYGGGGGLERIIMENIWFPPPPYAFGLAFMVLIL